MNVFKEAAAGACGAPEPGELEAINAYALRSLKGEEVFCFSVILCDNRVDRDGERFDIPALHALAELFLGKSGLFDHSWSAHQQTARIFHTQVVTTGPDTGEGEPLTMLKARAYMLRSAENAGLIAEIEAGIKKEVSVGCAVKSVRCSICGGEIAACGHERGAEYDGVRCHAVLAEPLDAFEWSFVAVPAQTGAGVSKSAGGGQEERFRLMELELKALRKSAAMGQRYMSQLRGEVLRLSRLCGGELPESAAEKLTEDELLRMKRAYRARVRAMYPPEPQLRAAEKSADPGDEDYKI